MVPERGVNEQDAGRVPAGVALTFNVLRIAIHSEQRPLGGVDMIVVPPQHRPDGIAIALYPVGEVFEIRTFVDAGVQVVDVAKVQQVVGNQLVVAFDV